ncbi:MAG: type II toxin-antitoxin system prevent-host-death family antitoxin [Candidatus Hydrogenedentes bacterium]|nr:type II toxin-antitoxin system prevent-host-death family antitoxin [Candidatus Hydrogenedentota bacterium]
MNKVGAFEAKTHLSKLLERVAQGERFTIEKHGVPIAILQPSDTSRQKPVTEVITELRQFRSGHSLGRASIRKMIAEGRR